MSSEKKLARQYKMNLKFNTKIANDYSSNSQIARVLTENWVKENIYCPCCGNSNLSDFKNNKPVADFFCNTCTEEFELKSKNGNSIGEKIIDGAYSSMINRIKSVNNPNFFFLHYNKTNWSVNNFLIIPKHYFVSDIIEKRKPLNKTAKRAGWVGCNILLSGIPQSGRIYLIKNSEIISKAKVQSKWRSTEFLSNKKLDSRGWIIDIMNCLEKIKSREFSINEIYSFENELKNKYPNNNHIKEKIRQQLQLLRNKGLIEFKGSGKYKKLNNYEI